MVAYGQVLTLLQMIAAVSANPIVIYFGVKPSSSWSSDDSLILMSKSKSISSIKFNCFQGAGEGKSKSQELSV